MTRPQLDPKISFGHLLQAGAMIVAVAGAYFFLDGRVAVLETRLDYVEADTSRRLKDISDKLDKLTDHLLSP